MKRIKLKTSILSALAALLFVFPAVQSHGLKEITKPYLGQYECKSATLGDKEYLDGFSYIRLELKPDETFSLYYCPKEGKAKEEKGKYSYNAETGELLLSIGRNDEIKRKFPLQEGKLTVSLRLGGKTLVMKFEQK